MAIESSIIFLPCVNIDETERFYVDVVGLKLHQDQGICRIFDTGYGYWGFCQYGDRNIITGACLSLNCEDEKDVDKHFKMVVDKGVEVIAEPKLHERFPVYSCFIKDPNGYTIEFQKILK